MSYSEHASTMSRNWGGKRILNQCECVASFDPSELVRVLTLHATRIYITKGTWNLY